MRPPDVNHRPAGLNIHISGFLYAIQFGLPMLLMLSFVFTALSITREIVHEKERRLKESMKMMGLYNAVHWAAWYFKCIVFLLVRARRAMLPARDFCRAPPPKPKLTRPRRCPSSSCPCS